MKKRFMFRAALALLALAPICNLAANVTFDLGILNTGYRFDKAGYSFFLNSTGDTFAGEMKGLDLYMLGWDAKLNVDNFILRTDVDVGWVMNSDLSLSGDTDFTQYYNHLTKGNVFDVSVDIGYLLPVFSKNFSVTPFFGYAYNYQNYREKDKRAEDLSSVIYTPSTYYTPKWNSIYGGVDFGLVVNPRVMFDLAFQYHYACYKAKQRGSMPTGNFNTAQIFRANGWGPQLKAKVAYEFVKTWLANVELDYRHFITGKGTVAGESGSGSHSDHFFGANWSSLDVKIGIQKRF